MVFLQESDFKMQIREDVLSKITDADNTILDDAELAAIEEITSYLQTRYDVAAVFDAQDAERSRILVMYTVDVMLYHLHSRINPRQIPELRYVRYEKAIKWLEWVSNGKIIAPLPPKPDPDNESPNDNLGVMKIATFTKRRNNY